MSDIVKRCVECGTEVPTVSETPLCSKDCQIEYAHRMVREMSDSDAWCPTCHDEFDSISSVCYHHNKSHSFNLYRTEICENCGDQYRPSSTTNELKYCSRECFGEDNRVEPYQTECDNCGKNITSHYPSRKYCSHSCANSREHHWNWKGGSEKIRNTPEYREWRQSIYDKFDACSKCGATEDLHAHHIVPVSVSEEMATNVSNGTLLCGECHSEEHPDMPDSLFTGDV